MLPIIRLNNSKGFMVEGWFGGFLYSVHNVTASFVIYSENWRKIIGNRCPIWNLILHLTESVTMARSQISQVKETFIPLKSYRSWAEFGEACNNNSSFVYASKIIHKRTKNPGSDDVGLRPKMGLRNRFGMSEVKNKDTYF